MTKTRQTIPVYNHSGKRIGVVSESTTSVGASKLTGAPMKFEKRNGAYSWVLVK